MKKLNREINVFSMSALDLFASALGAFIILGVLLLPYFPNTGDSPERVAAIRALLQAQIEENARQAEQIEVLEEEIQETRQELEGTREETEETWGELQETREALRTALKKKYLLLVISWATQDDVDLHVVDPDGREFYYDDREFPGSPARFEEDNIQGPGNEIWLHPEVAPGQYRIYYKLYNQRTSSVSVRGLILHPDGREEIPSRLLSRGGEKPLIAVVHVGDDGTIEVR